MQQSVELGLRQQLRLSPQILMSLQFLQLPVLDLEQRVSQELEENPFLELKEREPEIVEPGQAPDEAPTAEEADTPESEALVSLDAMEAELADYMDRASEMPGRFASRGTGQEKMEALANVVAPGATLQEHLEQQLHLMDLDPLTRQAAELLIANIDANGYIPYVLEELASMAGDDGPGLEHYEEALRLVQALDPPGVGARDLRECLTLQLDPENPKEALARQVLAGYMTELSKNQLPKIARSAGVSIEEVNEALAILGRLNPRPGLLFSHDEPHYVVPDVIVEELDGRFEVRLEDGRVPEVMVSPAYQRLLHQARDDPKVAEMLRRRLDSAKWVVASIEQRRMTLFNVAKAIVGAQEDYLHDGVEALKPLRQQDVADKLGIHVSTVGRAIAGKYMQTPQGISPMKFFFSGGTIGDDGSEHSWRFVKQRIADMVEQEDKQRPLSDEEIVARLCAKGIDVARRTVAKYRTALGIPSSRKRKQFRD